MKKNMTENFVNQNWKSKLKADPTDWLLERDNPSVRYYTLTEILEMPLSDPEVIRGKGEIMKVGIVPKILAKQNDGGYWDKPEDFYIRSKYKGTVWTLIILSELRADGDNGRIRRACEFILENSQDRKSGGFSYLSVKTDGGDPNKILPCLTGNMIWCLIRFGYLEDLRVQNAIDWIIKYQRFDDGIEEAPKGWPYDKFEKCWGRHTCHMGVVKTLKALAEIPPTKRSKSVQYIIEKGVEYLLNHHIFKRSHNLRCISRPEWLRFGFPWMGNTDVLEVLVILTKLGYKDRRMQDAMDLVISKQDNRGRWILESTFNGRFQVNIEKRGKPSKWVTLNALRVIKKI
jgi:hypothetical protein